jgi:hypothetical protein
MSINARPAMRSSSCKSFLVAAVLALIPATSYARINCQMLTPSTPDYLQTMDELALQANLPDAYWTRYHSSAVSDLCRGTPESIDNINSAIESGYVKADEVDSIAHVLGKAYKAPSRISETKSDDPSSFASLISFISNPIVLALLIIYFVPTILAMWNKSAGWVACFWVNLLFGWTLIGWIIAIIFASCPTKEQLAYRAKVKKAKDDFFLREAEKAKGK